MSQQVIQRLGFHEELGVFLARGKAQDGREVAAQHNRERARFGDKRHLIDERPENLGGLGLLPFRLQALVEALDALPINFRHVRMQQRSGLVSSRKPLLYFSLPNLKPLHVLDDGLDWTACLESGQELRQLAVDTWEFVSHCG